MKGCKLALVVPLCLFYILGNCTAFNVQDFRLPSGLNEHFNDHADIKRFLVDQQGGSSQKADWSDWGEWSQCIQSLDRLITERFRQCDNPPPSLFGRDCDGAPVEIRHCEMGTWSLWSGWSNCGCSRNQTRNRQCQHTETNGAAIDCLGSGIDVQQCVPEDSLHCPVNGVWSVWSSWLACSVKCGTGTQTRLRLCSNPPPSNGGKYCSGASTDTQSCKLQSCR